VKTPFVSAHSPEVTVRIRTAGVLRADAAFPEPRSLVLPISLASAGDLV
jgi:hypothetical protein